MEVEVKLRLPDVTAHQLLSDSLASHHARTNLQENLFFDNPAAALASRFALRLRFYNSDAGCVVSLKARATLSNDVSRVEEDEDEEDIDPALGRACVAEPWCLPAVTTSRIVGRVREELCVSSSIARQIFYKMPHRSQVSWNVTIDGYSASGEHSTVLSLFREMQHVFTPDTYTMQSVVAACGGLGTLSMLMWAYTFLIRNYSEDVPMNNSLVDAFAKCGSIDMARQVFDRKPTRDLASWNAMISGLAMHGCVKQSLRVFHRMVENGLKPSPHVLGSAKVNILTHKIEVKMADWQLDMINDKHKKHRDEDLLLRDVFRNSVAVSGSKIEKVRDNVSSDDRYGGTVWDIFRREDVPKLIEYLNKHKQEFRHINWLPIDSVVHPIHDQTLFLNEIHKKQLKLEYNVESWTFEQYIGEAVFIPAGCPHQVRNRQSCIKVALDFVSPENIGECLQLTDEFRLLPKTHRAKQDNLEVKKMTLYAASVVVREANKLKSKIK